MEVVNLDSDDDGSNVTYADQVYRLVIDGEPRAWERPKSYTKLMKGIQGRYKTNTVDTNKVKKNDVASQVRRQMEELYERNDFPLYGDDMLCTMEFEFYRRLPNTDFVSDNRNNGLRRYLSRFLNKADDKKPDLDNLVKLIKDALQGVLYKDDKQVVCYMCYKMVDVEPPHNGRTIVHVRQFKGSDLPAPINPQSRNISSIRMNGTRLIGDG